LDAIEAMLTNMTAELKDNSFLIPYHQQSISSSEDVADIDGSVVRAVLRKKDGQLQSLLMGT
jgi:hypothetical protein